MVTSVLMENQLLIGRVVKLLAEMRRGTKCSCQKKKCFKRSNCKWTKAVFAVVFCAHVQAMSCWKHKD